MSKQPAIALLSRGPSLQDNWATKRDRDASEYRDIIGVNNVVEDYQCSWWCFRDVSTFVSTGINPERPIIGTPAIFTCRQNPAKLMIKDKDSAQRFAIYPGKKYFHEDFDFPAMPPMMTERWYRWSGVAALGLACMICRLLPDVREVHCFGVDLAGLSDFQNKQTASRSASRWGRESLLWGHMVKAIEVDRNVKIIRHTVKTA